MLTLLNYSISSEIESTEKSLNQRNPIKRTCQGIRSIINIKDPTVPKIAQLNVKGRIFDNPKDIAEKVNDFLLILALTQKWKYQKYLMLPHPNSSLRGTNSISQYLSYQMRNFWI